MKLKRLGKTGPYVSEIGLGTLHFGVYLTNQQSAEIIHTAIDLGINFFDTSPIYGSGHSEIILGQIAKNIKNKIFISTKVGLRPGNKGANFNVEVHPLDKQSLIDSVENSLKKLKTESINLLQLHAFNYDTPLDETMEGLLLLIKSGKIQYFGVSNYDASELELLFEKLPATLADKFISFQTHYNILERRAEIDLIPKCKRSGVGIIVNRALARGLLSGQYISIHEVPKNSRADLSPRIKNSISEKNLKTISYLKAYAELNKITCASLALKWTISQDNITSSLIGVRSLKQLEECVSACNITLSDQNFEDIDEIMLSCDPERKYLQMPSYFFEK